MADWEDLGALLDSCLQGATEIRAPQQQNYVILKETGKDAKLKRVDIVGVSCNALLVKIDDIDYPEKLFTGIFGKGTWDGNVRRRCDYVLFTEYHGEPIVLLIELKSARFKRKDVCEKFLGTECIMDYFDSIGRRFHVSKSGFTSGCDKYYVLFKTLKDKVSVRKRPSVPKRFDNTPENPIEIADPRREVNLSEILAMI